MVLGGKDVIGETLDVRRALLEDRVLTRLKDPVRYSSEFKGEHGGSCTVRQGARAGGLIAKRRNSRYEPRLRSGAGRDACEPGSTQFEKHETAAGVDRTDR